MVSGFSLPQWNLREPYFKLLYIVSSQAIDIHEFKAAADKLLDIMNSELSDDVWLIIEYLSGPTPIGNIEAILNDKYGAHYYRALNKLALDFDRKDIIGHSHLLENLEVKKIAEGLRECLMNPQATGSPLPASPFYPDEVSVEDYRKLINNLIVNFHGVQSAGKRLEHIRFAKIGNPIGTQNGSIYFFSSFPLTRPKLKELVASLEDIIRIANFCVQVPLWMNVRTGYALRSATSSIMARNMSHNIGSHVSPRSMIGVIEERLTQLFPVD
jgi:hypothetical protein